MAVEEAVRMRVIRAILGMDMKTFAKALNVNHNTIRRWEDGTNSPNGPSRKVLAEICQEHGISIRADGYPVIG